MLLYDDACGFCSRTVQFILQRDPGGALRFAGLDSGFATRVFEQHPDLRGIDSIVWFEQGGAIRLVRSDAALRAMRYLGGRWGLVAVLRFLPRQLRDPVYDLVARHRHTLWPKSAQCFVPAPAVRHRFLERGVP